MTNPSFMMDEQGVWFCPPAFGDKIPDPIWICSPLHILAITRDENNQNHGRLLKFFDADKTPHCWAMPMEMLAGDGNEYRRILLSMGLTIAPGKKVREYLTHYIQSAEPEMRARSVLKTGWINDEAYVFPDKSIVKPGKTETFIFQSLAKTPIGYQVSGFLEEWQKNVSAYCIDNSRLAFAVSIAFAAPLLHLLGKENGGFHFRGPSSNGKTTLLKVATSVFGGKKTVHSWRATSNGLESIAALHNDTLLCLDELGQANAKEVGEIIYMLANGMGKLRANKNSSAKEKHEWNVLFLSSGEVSLMDHMSEAGKKTRGGQEIRIIDIPSSVGNNGAFESLHNFEDGANLSRHLCHNSEKYFGIPAREYIAKIVSNLDHIISQLKNYMAQFIEIYAPNNMNGQIDRVLHKFALVAAAGRLATELGITGWPEEEAFQAASQCFNSWVETRGGLVSQEEIQALKQVRLFFEQHGDARFTNWHDTDTFQDNEPNTKTINRAGYKKEVNGEMNFYVFPEVFKIEICSGLNPEFVAKTSVTRGWVIPDSEGKSSRSEHLPCSQKSIRCYRFVADKVFGDVI